MSCFGLWGCCMCADGAPRGGGSTTGGSASGSTGFAWSGAGAFAHIIAAWARGDSCAACGARADGVGNIGGGGGDATGGVDSLAATELSGQLRGLTGVQVSGTLLFEHPAAQPIAAASAGGGLDGARHGEPHVSGN